MFIAISNNSTKSIGGVRVLNKADRDHNVSAMASVLNRCKETMQSPRMMHFIVEAKFDLLPEKMVQRVKEAYISEFKRFEKQRLDRNSTVRKRNCPAIEMIYSIESKMINDYQYDHIHFMFIVDFGNNRFGYQEIMSVINRTLGRLDFVVPIDHIDDFNYIGFKGKNSCGYCRYRNRASRTISNDALMVEDGSFKEVRGHDLKTEFNDAVIRASYLCKSEQKELLPHHIKRYSFGHTRAPRARSNIELDLVA